MSFLTEISADIDWRMSELASLKTIPFRYNILEHHKNILIKYSIPALYAVWEGYVKQSFTIYIRELNRLQLSIDNTHLNLLTHALSTFDKLSLENPRMNFQSKKEFVEFYQNSIGRPLNIGARLPTKSNIDFNVINEMLHRFNLQELTKNYEKGLKNLVRFRNNVAHGDNSIPIDDSHISEFSVLINNLMVEIFNRIEDGYKQKTYCYI